MPQLDILFFAVIAIVIISVFFSIAAWISLARIASKTNQLESEIEKKSLEFDSLKKERINESHGTTEASVIESNEHLDEIMNQTASLHDTIQIFRNVRGTFEHSEQSIGSPPSPSVYAYPDGQQQTTLVSTDVQAQSIIVHQPESAPVLNEEITPPPPPPTASEQMQPEYTEFRKPSVETESHPITLSLYSEITKDADFQSLWKKITEILQNHPAPNLAIDLSDINFLYEKEMDYLEKINYLICNQGGTLALINCEQDLVTLLNRKHHLGSIVTL